MIIEKMMDESNLTETEKQIKRFILDSHNDISSMTSQELGRKSYTSQASIVRFYKKMGFQHYRDFISSLNIERQEYFKIADIDMNLPSQYFTSYENVQTSISRLYATVILKTNILLNKNKLIRICNRLSQASCIDIYAIGIDDVLGKQFVYKLQSLGFTCILHNTLNMEYIKHVNKKSISILIQCLEESKTYLSEIADILQQNHIYTISIVNNQNINLFKNTQEQVLYYIPEYQDINGLIDLFSAEYVMNFIYLMLKGRYEGLFNSR